MLHITLMSFIENDALLGWLCSDTILFFSREFKYKTSSIEILTLLESPVLNGKTSFPFLSSHIKASVPYFLPCSKTFFSAFWKGLRVLPICSLPLYFINSKSRLYPLTYNLSRFCLSPALLQNLAYRCSFALIAASLVSSPPIYCLLSSRSSLSSLLCTCVAW